MKRPGVMGRQRHFRFDFLMTEVRLFTKMIWSVTMVACVALTLTGCGHATITDHFPKGEQDQLQDQEAEKQKEEKKP